MGNEDFSVWWLLLGIIVASSIMDRPVRRLWWNWRTGRRPVGTVDTSRFPDLQAVERSEALDMDNQLAARARARQVAGAAVNVDIESSRPMTEERAKALADVAKYAPNADPALRAMMVDKIEQMHIGFKEDRRRKEEKAERKRLAREEKKRRG